MFSNSFKLSGLTCPACKKVSEKRLSLIPGAVRVEVNLDSGETAIEADRQISSGEIKLALKDTHYQLVK